MPPIPIMSTETLASCAEERETGAAQTNAANRTGLTIGRDLLARPGYRESCSFGVRGRYGGPFSHDALFSTPPQWAALRPLGRVHAGFLSGRLTSSNAGTCVLSNHDSNVAPQTLQDAWPVCGTKNFVSVRLYSAPHRLPLSVSAFFTQSCNVCGVQPILAEIETTAAQREACSPSWSKTIRTARVRTSGENLFVVLLVMAPTFSRVGASGNPGAVHTHQHCECSRI